MATVQSQKEALRSRGTAVPAITIEPPRGWSALDLHELWEYRELLWFLILRDVKGRYRQMALGPLWIVIQPLINMVVFSLVFGELAQLPSEGVPYPIFTFTALLPWTYFAGAAQDSVTSLAGQMSIISKVYYPRLIAPISAVLTGLVDLTVSFLLLLGMMFVYGVEPSLTLLVLPLYVLLATATSLGIGLWLATVAVRYRDLRFAIGHLIRIGMYATPVAYSASLIPDKWQFVYQLNPMFWVVEGFRWAVLGSGSQPKLEMLISIGLAALILVTGAFAFRRTEMTIVDWL